MNRPPHHLSDEALSAHADVASDRATRREVEDHLDSCDRCAARLETLSRARDALRGGLVETVDQLTRRRLVSRAVSAAAGGAARRPSRRVAILTAAAAVVVTVGVVGAARLGSDDQAQNLAASAGAFGLPIGNDRIVEEAGALDDPSALEAVLRSQVIVGIGGSGGADAEAGGQAATSGGGGIPAGVEADDGNADAAAGTRRIVRQGDASTTAEESEVPAAVTAGPPEALRIAGTGSPAEPTLTAIARCYRAVAGSLSEESRLTAAATGSYADQRVVVLGFRTKTTRLLAMVLSRDDCSIVTAQSFQ